MIAQREAGPEPREVLDRDGRPEVDAVQHGEREDLNSWFPTHENQVVSISQGGRGGDEL